MSYVLLVHFQTIFCDSRYTVVLFRSVASMQCFINSGFAVFQEVSEKKMCAGGSLAIFIISGPRESVILVTVVHC